MSSSPLTRFSLRNASMSNLCGESVVVAYFLRLKVNGELVAFQFLGSCGDGVDLACRERHGE